jgi:signal transduction histidine kinase
LIDRDLAAVLSFTALGANLLGAVLLMLLNTGSRSVRWYIPFQLSVILWLLGQGMEMLYPSALWESFNIFGVVLMPLMFVLFAIFESSTRPSWQGIVLTGIGLLLLPFVMNGFYDAAPAWQHALMWIWLVGGWIGASVILAISNRRKARIGAQPEFRKRLVLLAFILIAPLCVIISLLFGGPTFITYGMPVVTIFIVILIFYGIMRMQLYDVEVRVRRSGDIAAETAETERLAVLGEMAATIAHEVRNPLTGVRSLAQRLSTEDISPEKRKKYGEVILEETSRVERLVSNLLELSRRGGRPESNAAVATTTSLATLFEDLTLLVASRAERARIQVISDANDISIAAPREALAQVLLNLLLNAIAHSPENNVVKMTAESAKGRVIISVRDHGAGIPAGQRERIFDPFYTTSANGTGLGLSVVRHLVREHEWNIDIADAPGGGARFTLTV